MSEPHPPPIISLAPALHLSSSILILSTLVTPLLLCPHTPGIRSLRHRWYYHSFIPTTPSSHSNLLSFNLTSFSLHLKFSVFNNSYSFILLSTYFPTGKFTQTLQTAHSNHILTTLLHLNLKCNRSHSTDVTLPFSRFTLKFFICIDFWTLLLSTVAVQLNQPPAPYRLQALID